MNQSCYALLRFERGALTIARCQRCADRRSGQSYRTFVNVNANGGTIFADLVDALLGHRKVIRRPLGKTAAHSIERLKVEHGLGMVAIGSK
jgi:hypothetical protein